VKEFLGRYGFPAYDEFELQEGDGTRPAVTVTSMPWIWPRCKLSPRIHDVFWNGHRINALVLRERLMPGGNACNGPRRRGAPAVSVAWTRRTETMASGLESKGWRYALCSGACRTGSSGMRKAGGKGPAAPPVTEVGVTWRLHATCRCVRVRGQTQSSQQVEIRARVNGFLEQRLCTEGTMVKAGEVLFRMDQKPFKAALDAAMAELAQQQARLTTARANLARAPLAARMR
jgi:membrane fusion protein (multidrug efflux system)